MIRTTAAGVLIALVTLAGVPASASATDDVRGAMLKFAGLSSYEMTFGAGARRGTVDFVKPDALHVVTGPFEMVRIGKTTYMKQGAGGWMKLHDSPGAGPAEIADRIRDMTSKANAMTATDLGMKSVDGESLHAYRVSAKQGSPSTVYIAGDGLPHRFESGNSTNNVVRLSKFNAVAPIRPPV